MSKASRPVPAAVLPLRSAVRLYRRTRARMALGLNCTIANDAVIGPRARWLSQGRVDIASRVFIGADFFVETDLSVGPDVLISSRVALVSDDHPFDSTSRRVTDHHRRPASLVVIEGDNLIGHGTMILGPAVIGRGTIVGAGSLVIGDLPPDSICVGRPARRIRGRRGAT